MPSMDDAALVEAARSGDDTAWAAIYDRYADKLHDHCHRILRDRHEAGDALHDAFLAASRNLHQLRDPTRLRPWLYSICRHTSLRRLKARDRVDLTDAPDDMSPAADADLDRGVRAQELSELVWAAAAGLNGRDQALLDLHLRQGLEGQDLADAMGTSLSNSYVMLSRMRDQVERSLGALLIARMGREDCQELDALLDGWDGRFSPLLRKRVARHVDGCDTCNEKRRTVASPLALLAAAPLVPAPAALKARVISSIRNTEVVDAPHVPFTKEGFAALGRADATRRVRAAWLAVAAAVLVVLLGGGFLLAAGDGDDQPVETAAADSTTRRDRERATTTTTSEEGDEALAPGTDGGAAGDEADDGPGLGQGDDGGADGGSGPKGGSGGSSDDGGAAASDDGPSTTSGSPSTTAKPANDGFGPKFESFDASGGRCTANGRVVTLTAEVTDPSGVKAVNVTMLNPLVNKKPLQHVGGDTWRTTVTVPPGGGSFTVVLEAIDSDGVDTDDPFGFTVTPCPTTTTTTAPGIAVPG